MAQKQRRRNFGKTEKNLPKLDLSKVQKESWELFLSEGIGRELSEISPIDDFTGKNWQLVLGEHTLGVPNISSSKASQKGLTYSSPLNIKATLISKRTGKEISQQVFLGDLPQMTSRGTFIINGIERTVINQLVRSPGVYFSGDLDVSSGRMLYRAEVRPLRGSWLELEVGKNNVISARIDRKRKVVVTAILRAMGIEKDEEILSTFAEVDKDADHKYIAATLEKDPTS
ncbi:DNA-directed RNA polymerase subunit beta, partial [Candidatus Woesebacteria bacterium]|nr:DNA-directed RNA polymerase subunit beta [Candidatus Woesebacteria bacterium]